jgi:hypothetical protein
MKYTFLGATIGLQFLLVYTLKLGPKFGLIIGIIIMCLIVGGVIRFSKSITNIRTANLGWGLFWGSLTSLLLIVVLILGLYISFPKIKH